MENQPKLTDIKEIIKFLAERFPHCFSTEGEALPLKIGIFQDLVTRVTDEPQISKTQLRSALRRYTSSWRYLHGLRVGAQRVDLDGQYCGVIEQQHVEHAQQQLAEAKQRLKQRQQQRGAQRTDQEGVVKKGPAVGRARKKAAVDPASTETAKPKSARISSPKPTRSIGRDEINCLQIGQEIAVKAGKSVVRAIILEIAKDGVRVQLSSGMAVLVRLEHLQI